MVSTEARTEPGAQWKPEVEVPIYSLKEVAAHNKKNDMWIVVHGKVYDVTNYLLDHPGGTEAIEEVAGTDCTAAFEDVGHSEDARELLQPLLIGVLSAEEAAANKPKKAVRVVSRTPSSSTTAVAKSGSGSSIPTAFLTTLTLTALAAAGTRAAITARLIDPALLKRLPTLPSLPVASGPNDFWSGVLLSTAAFALGSAYAFNRASAAFTIGTGFGRYPSRIKVGPSTVTRQVTGFLDAHTYKPLPLVRIDQLSPNTVRYVFALPDEKMVLGLPIGQHVSIRGTLPDGTHVARSYTPTSNNSDPGKLELVIKLYPDGALTGGYLANLRVGDEVAFRGPKGAMRYRRGWARRIGMVAGGTGITPMYQLIRAICEDPKDLTEVSLVYANRGEEDILLREELDRFARLYPRNFRVHYMLDHPPAEGGWTGGVGYVTKEVMKERLPAVAEDTKIVLCGPPGMVKAAKGSLKEMGFQVPGTVCKMSDQVFTF
ncbi:Cytochrome b5 [Lasiodiplodia theobromae]|uniref:Cytochrome b5 n=1 Tax=Lasiodiplodia theobromae TaxID=45133 RepID=UPI0015C402E0|nr:Cytochrome b5 [Lasiodiplodia theobromae]KAF4544365.1 Cytochrome b5 [Lasiodiplodia theobromae]